MAKTSDSIKSQEKVKSQHIGAGAKDSLLKEFFIHSLQDVYYAEKAITKALPKMKKAATSSELQDAFDDHLVMTQQQITRLEEVFGMIGEKPKGKTCEAIEGIIKEGEGIIEETDGGTATRDVGLIMAAQKVEHYEIATYGSLVQLAETLGFSDAAEALRVTLNEEKETDQLLTQIAENNVNYEAGEETEAK